MPEESDLLPEPVSLPEPSPPREPVSQQKVMLLLLGVLQILFGLVALSSPFLATYLTITFLGWLIFLGGLTEAANCFLSRHKTKVYLGVLSAVLGIVAGIFMIGHPVAAAEELTLIVAMFLMVGGLYRFLATSTLTLPYGTWACLSGAVTFFLGLMVWRHWPMDGVWFIGMCVGVDLLFYGIWWVLLALSPPEPEVSSNDLYSYE